MSQELSRVRTARFALAASLFALIGAGSADASLVATFEVGSGGNASHLQFDFQNGNSYLYLVHWEGTVTGRDLFDIVGAAQPGYFTSDIVTFPFGDALFGQSIGSDANAGFGSPPDFLDFWHYWTKESATAAWESSFVGFGDRIVSDGSWDGWVFGSDGAPAAVPAPGVTMMFTSLLAVAARRRRSK
ncbi:MAG: hypothetical protein JNL80_17265 [Phycisphaerae bacterium]|jgi:hypothetical protein|nr:hypothetical protein [Phycisphaerae bacterium]